MSAGVLGYSATPVSPVTPFSVMPTVFPLGGTMIALVLPDGTEIVLAPLDNVVTCSMD